MIVGADAPAGSPSGARRDTSRKPHPFENMDADQQAEQRASGDVYGATWSSHIESRTRQRIRREVYGDEYPEEADPRSYLTRTELRRLARELCLGAGTCFIDLGCGQAGPSLWVVQATGATVVGIDVSSIGIARATQRAHELGLADRARFEVADMTDCSLPEASFDGAMSVDVLWAVPDKARALRETARILRPGARFVFTTWDRDLSPPGYPPPLPDHRPFLENAGFEVENYEVQPEAEARRRAYYERVVAAEPILIEEMGMEGAQKLMFEAKGTLGLTDGTDYLAHSRRIFVVARRRGSAAC
jgi:ubiquinone/menaquinone biosynthesis C-methylase UbiE